MCHVFDVFVVCGVVYVMCLICVLWGIMCDVFDVCVCCGVVCDVYDVFVMCCVVCVMCLMCVWYRVRDVFDACVIVLCGVVSDGFHVCL